MNKKQLTDAIIKICYDEIEVIGYSNNPEVFIGAGAEKRIKKLLKEEC